MKNPIVSYRQGHATNSSSSHSIIFKKKNTKISDKKIPTPIDGFGWEDFVLVSRQEKIRYLAAQLKGSLSKTISNDNNIISPIVANLLKLTIDQVLEQENVDHQSQYIIPYTLDSTKTNKKLNMQFIKELCDFILDDKTVILGGNDNEERKILSKVNTRELEEFRLPLNQTNTFTVARKDPVSNYWIIFDPDDGTKIRFNFSDQPSILREKLLGHGIPELVDIKITDYCTFNCSYCYQGSTISGKHADINYLRDISNMLEDLGVFEVALGGGEPTQWEGGTANYPISFPNVISQFMYKGVNISFTTRNLSIFIENPNMLDATRMGYSVDHAEKLLSLSSFCQKYNISKSKITIQIVPEIINLYAFKEILRICAGEGFDLLLLGHKINNRGVTAKVITDIKSIYGSIRELYKANPNFYINISADTCFMKATQKLNIKDISRITYDTNDGLFSLYIDAVSQTMNLSSYSTSTPIKLDTGIKQEEFISLYKKLKSQITVTV